MALKPFIVKLLGGAQLDLDAKSNFASFECLFLSALFQPTRHMPYAVFWLESELLRVDRRVKFFMFKY